MTSRSTSQRPDEDFVARQREHYREADAEHFRWQTEASYFARSEAALVADVPVPPGGRLLEIGCGEGGNLFHLQKAAPRRFGVDFSPAKVAFAGRRAGALTAAADGALLPFADCTFDTVLIRDLLHHVPDRTAVLAEARRVLRRGGHAIVIEPNIAAPLILLQAAIVPAERGLFRSTSRRLREELTAAGLDVVSEEHLQPLPLARVLTHPRLRLGHLLDGDAAHRALDAVESMTGRLVPRAAWLYLKFRARRPFAAEAS